MPSKWDEIRPSCTSFVCMLESGPLALLKYEASDHEIWKKNCGLVVDSIDRERNEWKEEIKENESYQLSIVVVFVRVQSRSRMSSRIQMSMLLLKVMIPVERRIGGILGGKLYILFYFIFVKEKNVLSYLFTTHNNSQ